MDFATTEGQKLLVALDGHSKWPEVRIMKRTDAASLIEILRTMFATWGLPEEMVSDNGPPFQSVELAEFFKNNGIRHTFSPTYHPSSNGLSEVGVKTVNLSLEKQLLDTRTSSRSLQHRIDAWCFSYRNTPHTVIGVTPFELFLGRQPRTPLSFLRPSNIMAEKMRELQEKKKMNQRAKVTTYQPGDKVLVRSVTHRVVNWVPGTIECAVSSVSHEVLSGGRVRQVSSSYLRRRSDGATCLEDDPLTSENPVPPPSTSPSAPVASPSVPPPPEPAAGPPPDSEIPISTPTPRVRTPPTTTIQTPLTPRVQVQDGRSPAPQGDTPSSPTTPRVQGREIQPEPGPSQAGSTPTRAFLTSRVGRRIVPPSKFKDFVL